MKQAIANTESRVKKTLMNARVNLIFYFLTLVLSFFSRKIFLDCLGANFVGLTGTLQNLLGFLNLAELGIGQAIGFVLYKPLFDRDHEKINEIISVMGYLYRWIGTIILAAGIILSFFLPLIFPDKDTSFELPLIYSAYYAFLASSLIGYFINYRQNLLGADQRNYIVAGFFQSINIIKTVIQMFIAYYTKSYYLWFIIELSFGIIYSFILNWKINQTYPWLKANIKLGHRLFKKYPEVIKYTKQLFIHKISGTIQFQTTPFLIYSFVNLHTVAFYGNYTIVTEKLSSLFSSVLGSTGASVGNLIVEGNNSKILSVFWELFTIHLSIAAFCVFELFILINPFIKLWIGGEYILPNIVVILILARCFISQTRGAVDQFLFGYGLFYDIWAPIAECLILLIVAIIGGSLWGLPGVLLGGVLSLLVIVWGWKPIFLFKKGFKLPLFRYWGNLLKYYILMSVAMFLAWYGLKAFVSINPMNSITDWVFYGILSSIFFIIVFCTIFFIFTPGMRMIIHRFIKGRIA